ncbi:MAG: glycosyltransferase family 4 protein [Myxococcota bacterium]|nr:glycosyltransferase family 4 protein [Myxococcota bacterium]
MALRVLHFVPYFPPDRIGGVGAFAAQLHAGLRERGVESTVVTRGQGPDAPGVHRIAASRLGWFLGTLRWTRRAAACDVVHCQSGEALPVMLALRLWPGRRARMLATFHSDTRRIARANRPYRLAGRRFGPAPAERLWGEAGALLHRWVDRAGLALADAINTVARSSALDLLGTERGTSTRVIYNGVGPAPVGEDTAPVEVLYTGVAAHHKRVLVLPFLLQAIRRECPDARLRIAGFPPQDAPVLVALFAELGLTEAVDFVGRREPAALAADFRAARVAVIPSAYEGLPYALLEALRAGTPVVATRVSGHPEAIDDGENGFLVPVDDPDALAARCIEILQDPELARRLGAAGRARIAERFDLNRQVDAYLEIYRTLAGDNT